MLTIDRKGVLGPEQVIYSSTLIRLLSFNIELPTRPPVIITLRIRLHDTSFYPGILLELFQMGDKQGSMSERTEKTDVEMVTILFRLEGAGRCNFAVEGI